MTTRSGTRFVLAHYARLEIALAIHREFHTNYLETLEQLSVSIWSQDRIRQTCVLVSASPIDGPHADRSLWEHDDGVGHVDLVWRARKPLVLPRLTMSTRAAVMQADDPAVCVVPFRLPPEDVSPDMERPTVCYVETTGPLSTHFGGADAERLATAIMAAIQPLVRESEVFETERLRSVSRPDSDEPRSRLEYVVRTLMGRVEAWSFPGVAAVDLLLDPAVTVPRASIFVNSDWLVSRRSRIIQRSGVFRARATAALAPFCAPEPDEGSQRGAALDWLEPTAEEPRLHGDLARYLENVSRYRVTFFSAGVPPVAFEFHLNAGVSTEFRATFELDVGGVGLGTIAEIVARIRGSWSETRAVYRREVAQGLLRSFLDAAHSEKSRSARGRTRLQRSTGHLAEIGVRDVISTVLEKAEQLRAILDRSGENLVMTTVSYGMQGYALACDAIDGGPTSDAVWQSSALGVWCRVELKTAPSDPALIQLSRRRNAAALSRLVSLISARVRDSTFIVRPIARQPEVGSNLVGIRFEDLIHFIGAAVAPDGRSMPYQSFAWVRNGDCVLTFFSSCAESELRSWLEGSLAKLTADPHGPGIPAPPFHAVVSRWHRLEAQEAQLVAAVPWTRARVRAHQLFIETRASDLAQVMTDCPVSPTGLAVTLHPLVSNGRLTADAVRALRVVHSPEGSSSEDDAFVRALLQRAVLDRSALSDQEPRPSTHVAALVRLIGRVLTHGQFERSGETRLTGAPAHAHGFYIRPIHHSSMFVPRAIVVWIVEESRNGRCRSIHAHDGAIRHRVDALCSASFPPTSSTREHGHDQAKTPPASPQAGQIVRDSQTRGPVRGQATLLEASVAQISWCGQEVQLKEKSAAYQFLLLLVRKFGTGQVVTPDHPRNVNQVRRALQSAQVAAEMPDAVVQERCGVRASTIEELYGSILRTDGERGYLLVLPKAEVSDNSVPVGT